MCVVTTPAGREFLDVSELEELTGYAVRTEFRKPSEPSPGWPRADAVAVVAATINTICEWAAGITDNLALSMLYECMGLDVPIVAAPNVNPSLARHPAFQRSVAELRSWACRSCTNGPRRHQPGWRAGSGFSGSGFSGS